MKNVPDKKKIAVIIAAGGNGKRFGSENKLFLNLGGVPVFIRTIKIFMPLCHSGNMIVPVHESELDVFTEYIEKFIPDYRPSIINGGATRTMSVWNALSCLDEDTIDYVAIHDAARPFASAELFMDCLAAAVKYGGALAARPVSDTVKRAGPEQFIAGTLDRSVLWTVETPQIFNFKMLKGAYAAALKTNNAFTDDAGIMEHAGHKVFLVKNTAFNLKITYPADEALAEAYLKSQNKD
jgi:2-C-methyl-D-erythritol 4-phosphate cytidylyltransferase/2-C-methyl-D-erythritol 4-phosphate cytidylyltransferase/2-C-methyl-D-erythritol 2,4-cyclodiphosphate synthase